MLLQKRIFEWSKELPLWQRDLMRRLATGSLDDAGAREVLRILAGAPEAPEPEPLRLADLPADDNEHGRVELRGVRDLRNINCLAPNQTLAFEPGLNIVFGDTGAGKSGYGRLLRRVTRSGDADEILRDVFDPGVASEPQTVDIDISVDDVARSLPVNLAEDPDRVLSAISIFDAKRAQFYLAKPNVIEHVPRPLQLLGRLSAAQDRLADDLRERARTRQANLPGLPEISPDTPTGRVLAGINGGSNAAALIDAARLSDAEKATLNELEIAGAAIRADQGNQLEAAARAQAEGAQEAVRVLGDADSQLTVSTAPQILVLRGSLDDVTAGERALADRAFSQQQFVGTGQGPWREMWFAAERFARESGNAFPDIGTDAACPLCQQDLDEDARARLQGFREFVSSDLRQQATDLEGQLATTLRALPNLHSVRATVEGALRGAPDTVVSAAADALGILDSRAEAARKAAAAESVDGMDGRRLDLTVLSKHADDQFRAAERQVELRDHESQRKIMAQLAELQARAALLEAESTVTTQIKGLKTIARIDDAIAKLNTSRISHKLRELQELAVTERLRKAVENELDELDPVAGRIEITGQASKGETVIRLKLKEPCRAKVGNVFSDGEQGALSLAFFLAELAVSEGRSAIVLDDPVSSLDHDRRVYIANRLAAESKRRQVIVFTHDMPFVHLMQEATRDADAEIHGQTLHRAFHRVGMVANNLPTKMLGTAAQLRTLEHRLRFELTPMHKRQDPQYEQEADRWVWDLRKAYEQLIVDRVFNGSVRPFNAHIKVRNLHDVKWTPDIAKRIDKGMKEASAKAHREPLELHPRPFTPSELTEMLRELTALDTDMGGKDAPTAVAPPEDSAALVIRAAQSQSV